MKTTIKDKIAIYLKENRHWIWGGDIEQYIWKNYRHKGGTTSRRLREMVEDNQIKRKYAVLENNKMKFTKVGGYVVYKI